MRDNGGILIAHLKDRTQGDSIVRTMSDLFEIPVEAIAELEAANETTTLPYQIVQRPTGFVTTVEIYAGADGLPSVPSSDAGFALKLAQSLGSDVAIAKPDTNASWLVIHPDGSASEGIELEADDNSILLSDVHPLPAGSVTFR